MKQAAGRVIAWFRLRPWVTMLLIVVVGQLGAAHSIQAEVDSRRESACEDASRSRRDVRSIVKEASLVTGTGVGKALAKTFPDADPADVERLRRNLVAQLTPDLETVVRKYPDSHWTGSECVDIPLDGNG